MDAVNGLPALEAVKIAKDPRFNMYHEFWFFKVFAIIWNHRIDLFRNPAVRRALTLAINRRELHRVLNLPDNTPILDVPITKGQFHRGELPEPLPYDPEQAKRLFDQAGWFEGKDGVRENNDREFRFSLLVSPEHTLAAVYIQDQFRKVGIRMEIFTLDRSVLKARWRSGEFDAILSDAPTTRMKWYLFAGYDNPEFTRLLGAVYWAPTPDEKDIAVRKLWPIYRTDVPFTFLSPRVTLNIVHRRIRGLKSPNRADPARFMEHLWIEEESGEPEEQNRMEK